MDNGTLLFLRHVQTEEHRFYQYIYSPNRNTNMRLASLLFVATSLFIYSCQKEIDGDIEPTEPENPPTVSGNLKAKIEGTQWVADKIEAASKFGGYINITGISKDKRMLVITLVDSGVHNYKLTDATTNAAALSDSSIASPLIFRTVEGQYPMQSGGQLNLTSIDTIKKTISGTFSFKVFNSDNIVTKAITEGTFTNLSYATAMQPASSTDTFRVKLNGTSWAPASIAGATALGKIGISATSSDATKTVGLALPANITPGTYKFELFGTYLGQYNPDTDPLHTRTSVSGTLTILEHNTTTKRIRGNFSFRAEEPTNSANFTNVSEGYFSVKYL